MHPIPRDKVNLDQWSQIICLKESGERSPIFVVNASGEWDQRISGFFCDHPVYQLKFYYMDKIHDSNYLKDSAGPHEHFDFVNTAKHNVEAMMAIQLKGPYILFAYCYSGMIAYEMAQQLHEVNEKVTLILLEVPSPSDIKYKLCNFNFVKHVDFAPRRRLAMKEYEYKNYDGKIYLIVGKEFYNNPTMFKEDFEFRGVYDGWGNFSKETKYIFLEDCPHHGAWRKHLKELSDVVKGIIDENS